MKCLVMLESHRCFAYCNTYSVVFSPCSDWSFVWNMYCQKVKQKGHMFTVENLLIKKQTNKKKQIFTCKLEV